MEHGQRTTLGSNGVEEAAEEVFREIQKTYSKEGEGNISSGYCGSNDNMEFAEDLIDSNGHTGGTKSIEIPDLPNILHETWKFHKEGTQMGALIGFMIEKSLNG